MCVCGAECITCCDGVGQGGGVRVIEWCHVWCVSFPSQHGESGLLTHMAVPLCCVQMRGAARAGALFRMPAGAWRWVHA